MGEPKDDVVLHDGRTMLDHVLDAVAPLGLPVHLSTSLAPRAGQLARGLAVIPDADAFEGPLAAIGRAMTALPGTGLVVVGCDQPLLEARLLGRLLPTDGDPRPAFLVDGGGASLAPLPGYYPAGLAAALASAIASGERSPRRWASTRPCRLEPVASADLALLRSFNSRAELVEAGLVRPG
jgi:molybdopterin-guanine dinucleotide biosynthesis protein A